ncbi:hypothetical protein ACWEKT_03075 [Nocardia takedensis]
MTVVGSGLPYFDVLGALGQSVRDELASIEIVRPGLPTLSFDWLLLDWATMVLELARSSDGSRRMTSGIAN